MTGVAEPLIRAERVSHWYGSGSLRAQVLHEVEVAIAPGEIVIMTGPSGSGKTTFLTLIGALRKLQEGRLSVLGRELSEAPARRLREVRREIGYIFQGNNLIGALTARQNVEMSLALDGRSRAGDRRKRALEMLEAVGLSHVAAKRPRQLSGGQRQRVAIARALATSPKLVLADEPTAALDTQSGRDVVQMMEVLARKQGSAVLLVTHDNRILDIADRIVNLEDGRLSSFTAAVAGSAQKMLSALARTARSGELVRRVEALPPAGFRAMLEETTAEFQRFLDVMRISNHEAFEGMLDQLLEAFTAKIGDLFRADRATVFLADRDRGELWTRGTREHRGEIRIPIGTGIAGHVATTGETLNIPDAYDSPFFNAAVDSNTGYLTKSVLAVPIMDAEGTVFAVMQLLNKDGGVPFPETDGEKLSTLASQVGVIAEAWVAMSRRERNTAA